MKKDFFKRGTALALSAAMAISLLPVISPLSKVDAATTETEKNDYRPWYSWNWKSIWIS